MFIARDDIITLLARNDPASADRLSDIHVTYRNVFRANLSTQTSTPPR
jgi:hypothetical protein